MEKHRLLSGLIAEMRERRLPAEGVAKFEALWKTLKPHDPYPCPECVCQGARGHLVALNEEEGFEPVVCKVCREQFDIPVPS